MQEKTTAILHGYFAEKDAQWLAGQATRALLTEVCTTPKPGLVDQNNNGKWDTGLFAENKQPEPVYYFPSEIELRASWDSEQEWNVRSTPLEKQKPKEITKQRAEKKREIQHRNAERLLKKQKEEQKKQRNKR